MSDGDQQVRRGLLARVLFELLRDAATPLAAKDAVARVKESVELNSQGAQPSRGRSGDARDGGMTWAGSV